MTREPTRGSFRRVRMWGKLPVRVWILLAVVLLNLGSGVGHLATAVQTGSSFSRFAAIACAVAVVAFGALAVIFYRRSRRTA